MKVVINSPRFRNSDYLGRDWNFNIALKVVFWLKLLNISYELSVTGDSVLQVSYKIWNGTAVFTETILTQ